MAIVMDVEESRKTRKDRLVARVPSSLKDYIKRVANGAFTYSKAVGGWTAPFEPKLIGMVEERFADLEDVKFTPRLTAYLKKLKSTQEQIIGSPLKCDPLFPDDSLMEFQRGSVRFLSTAKKCVLTHDMGLGKTVIACRAIQYNNIRKAIIIAPNSVKWAWVDHLYEWADWQDPVYVVDTKKIDDNRFTLITGNKQNREAQIGDFVFNQGEGILVMNYEQARIHGDLLQRGLYDALIIDEAHRIKGRQAQRTKIITNIAKQAAYVWMLTGTLIRNNYDDPYTLLHICDDTRFSGYWNFVKAHLSTSVNVFGGMDIIGMRNAEAYQRMLSVYTYGKKKKEVMPQLPPKIYHEIPLPMNKDQREKYKEMEDTFLVELQSLGAEDNPELLAADSVATQLLRLRQLCLWPGMVDVAGSSAKLDYLEDLFKELMEEGRTFLVFTWFRGFAEAVNNLLLELDIPSGMIIGGQDSSERHETVTALNDGRIRAITGTIGSMGEGLNLQKANTVVFTDQDWVPANNSQAEDRVHRANTVKSPQIIKIYHPFSVEEDVRAVCARKEHRISKSSAMVETARNMIYRNK